MDQRIMLAVVPLRALRLYPLQQVEDWGEGFVDVARLGDWRSEVALLVHGLIEKCLCDEAGITPEEVDAWDRLYNDLEEPGDHKEAPYHKQHKLAMKIEKHIIKTLGLSWKEHNKNIDKIFEGE
jgi:hypothetical protein